MGLETINIEIDADAAKAYRDATESQRRMLAHVLGWQIKDALTKEDAVRDLLEIMKEMSDHARRNGLTPEILQEILDER